MTNNLRPDEATIERDAHPLSQHAVVPEDLYDILECCKTALESIGNDGPLYKSMCSFLKKYKPAAQENEMK